MINPFTVEEINLICIFDARRRVTLIQELVEIVDSFEDRDMFAICVSALNKLSKMSDADYERLDFYPTGWEDEGGEF